MAVTTEECLQECMEAIMEDTILTEEWAACIGRMVDTVAMEATCGVKR